jgi:CheY-like chemotaxis protein
VQDETQVDVLLVEDDLGDAVMLIESFIHAGKHARFHAVTSCAGGLRFLRRCDEYEDAPRPSAIIMDLNLPDDHGLQFLAEVKADAELRTIPAIVLSGSGRPSDVRRSEALRADAFIAKPADFDGYAALVETISKFLVEAAETLPS